MSDGSAWVIQSVNNPWDQTANIFGGLPGREGVCTFEQTLGGQGAVYSVRVSGFGFFYCTTLGLGSGHGDWPYAIRCTSGSGTIDWYYSDSSNIMTIDVDDSGTYILSGGENAVSGSLTVAKEGLALVLQGTNSFLKYINDAEQQIPSISVPSDGTDRWLTFALMHPTCRGPVSCAYMVVTGPDGTQYNANTQQSNNIVVACASAGLSYFRVENPGAGAWTIAVTCPAQMPCYAVATLSVPGEAFDDFWNAYSSASTQTQWDLAVTDVLVPPDSAAKTFRADIKKTAAAEQPNWWAFAACKGILIAGYLAVITTFVAEFEIFPLLAAAAVEAIVKLVSRPIGVEPTLGKEIIITIRLIPQNTWVDTICHMVLGGKAKRA